MPREDSESVRSRTNASAVLLQICSGSVPACADSLSPAPGLLLICSPDPVFVAVTNNADESIRPITRGCYLGRKRKGTR